MRLKRILSSLMFLIEGGSVILLLLVIGIVFTQVVFRYILGFSVSGTEEAARYLLIYVVMLGVAQGVRNDSHMGITFFASRHRESVQKAMHLISTLIVLAVAILLMVKGYELMQRSMMMRSPALQIPRGYVALAFPLGGALCVIALLIRELQNRVKGKKVGHHEEDLQE